MGVLWIPSFQYALEYSLQLSDNSTLIDKKQECLNSVKDTEMPPSCEIVKGDTHGGNNGKDKKSTCWFSNPTFFWRKKQNQGQVALNNRSVPSSPVVPVSLHKLTLFPQQKSLFIRLMSSHKVM